MSQTQRQALLDNTAQAMRDIDNGTEIGRLYEAGIVASPITRAIARTSALYIANTALGDTRYSRSGDRSQLRTGLLSLHRH